MRLGVLYSGGKDSTLALYLAKGYGYEVSCLISLISENKDSYMFHTPSISKTKLQASAMGIPIILQKTKGKKEIELNDLEDAIKIAIKKYKINGIVTGAVESVYQSSRIQKICDKLKLECFNPLWQKDQFELLEDLIKNRFEIIITSVAAFPLDKSWLGRKIDRKFVEDMKILNEKCKINPAGEGGEFETFVLNCPMFKKRLKVRGFRDFSSGEHSHHREVEVG